jgi:hypothetical protein
MNQIANDQECINKYDDVFRTCELPGACTVKMKIIQEMIQIERPMRWNREKLETIIKELIKIEKYNANVTRSIGKFKIKWNSLENALNYY